MQEAEREGQLPPTTPRGAEEVLQGSNDDRGRDRRLNNAHRQANDRQNGEAQRQRVRHRERRDDLDDLEDGLAQRGNGVPLGPLAAQDGRQEESEEKEDVVDARGDVRHTAAHGDG